MGGRKSPRSSAIHLSISLGYDEKRTSSDLLDLLRSWYWMDPAANGQISLQRDDGVGGALIGRQD